MENNRPSIDSYYMNMVKLVMERSTCCRRQVGVIITTDKGHVLSTGYNGVPSGLPHCTEYPCPGAQDPSGDTSRCWAVHAEQNAIVHCRSLEEAHTLYTTCFPCFHCSKLIANTNIKRILFWEGYTDMKGVEILSPKIKLEQWHDVLGPVEIR